MENNTDLFTPLPTELSTPNGLLYQITDGSEKFNKNEFYTFEMDTFTVPEIDDIPNVISSLNQIPEETLMVPPLETLFSSVEPTPPVTTFQNVGNEIKKTRPKQISCDLCTETFYSSQVLRLHRRVQHTSTKEFRCRKCPISFNFETNLRLHLASHVSSCSTHKQCPDCKMVFKRISSFKGHLRTHQTNDRFKCNRCEKEFDLKVYYEKHLTKVHKIGVEGSIEEILGNGTKVRSRQKSTKLQGKYKCQLCGKSFSKPCLLKRHEVGHTGTKPFQCPECNQGFTQKTSLARHMLLHQGVKSFKCPKCSYSFSQKNNLIIHIKRTHPVSADLDKMFPCDICPCVFAKLSSVNRHKAIAHPKKENSLSCASFNDDDDENVNVARVMEQLKSFQESMGIMDMKPPALELSLLKPPSPGPTVNTVTVVDTINPNREKTFQNVKEIIYKGQRTIACIYCDKTFKRQFDLLRHQRTHTKDKPFRCEMCDKSFATSGSLKMHMNIHISCLEKPAKVYSCAISSCHKRFSSLRSLDIHTRTHTSTVLYICPICSKTFKSKAGFAAHKHPPKDKELESLRQLLMPPIKVDSNDTEEVFKEEEYDKRLYQCTFCGLKMQKLSHLRQHESTHNGEKLFQCEICLRSYTTRSSLNLHLKIHNDEKPHVCEKCDAKFITQSLLKRHMVSHSDERKFSCPYCNECFKTNDNCKNHILTHARNLLANEVPLPEDEEPTNNQDAFPKTISHQYITVVQSPTKNTPPEFLQLEMVKNCNKHKHKNLTIETLTKKSTKQSLESESVKEIKKTDHLCSECGKTFYKASDLERHKRIHTKEKPFKCIICSRRFALMSTMIQHKKIHDAERETFDCQVCGKKYTSKKVLTVHLRIHTGERPFQCVICKKTFRTSGHKIAHCKAHHKKRK